MDLLVQLFMELQIKVSLYKFITYLAFSSLIKSITTMIVFINLDHSDMAAMVEESPGASYFIIISYLYILYVILLNLIFVILLDAYETVRKKHVLTLLKYSIIWNGLVQFFNNWLLKIVTALRIKNFIFKAK
jgi:hypothetical protein